MIKLSSYSLTLALLTHSASNNRMASGAIESCVTSDDGTIATLAAGADCTYTNFAAALPSGCVPADIITGDAGEALTQSEIEAEVAAICEYDAVTQFVEIQGTYQKDRRYFAGGSDLVDGHSWNIASGDIKRFEDNMGSKTLIGFPEYAARLDYNNNTGLGENGYPANMNLETSCALKTVMCCFTDDSMGAFPSSTDVCRHDLADSPQSNHINEGWSVFPGSETSTYCEGFTFTDDTDDLIGNLMWDISLRNTALHGWREGVPGAPMCGCVEHMPVVEEAACRTANIATGSAVTYSFSYDAETGYVGASNAVDIEYADCPEGDLKAAYKAKTTDDDEKKLIDAHLVGTVASGGKGCDDDLEDYLNEAQFLHQGVHDSKYIVPDSSWGPLVVGEGINFQPPDIDPLVADTKFREAIEACLPADKQGRHCMVRRTCSSCRSVLHRDIYYKRLTALPPFGTNHTAGEVYLLDMFMNNWGSVGNQMGPDGDDTGDFQLFSDYDKAKAGTDSWKYCNYQGVGNYDGYGFPRNCGPTGVAHEWNAYVRHNGHGHANHHGFYVELPASAP